MWRVSLKLAPGIYEYKFLVDGQWVCKPGMDEHDPTLLSEADCVVNAYGTANRKLEVLSASELMLEFLPPSKGKRGECHAK